MATKTTSKKAPAKKVAVKKTVTKKAPVKKVATNKTVAAAPVMPVAHECPCGGHCQCHGHFWKKFLILLLVFALGCVCAGYFYKPHMPRNRIKFADNGCLVTETVKCPKMQELLATADVNSDGCITREEFKAAKKSVHKMHKMDK